MRLSDGVTTIIKGVFDIVYFETQQYNGRQSIFKITLADLTQQPVEGDTILIGSTSYRVVGHEPDAFGSTTLIIEKA